MHLSRHKLTEMSTKAKYWTIKCTKHLSTLYQTKVDTKYLSEDKLMEFIRILMSKYALSDDEILEQYLRRPFKKSVDFIQVVRTNSNLSEPLSINFTTQIADISVSAWLAD